MLICTIALWHLSISCWCRWIDTRLSVCYRAVNVRENIFLCLRPILQAKVRKQRKHELSPLPQQKHVSGTDLAMVKFQTVEQRVDDVVDGLLKNGFWLVLVGRPAADFLRDQTYVERQATVRERFLDYRQLTTGQRTSSGDQSLPYHAHAQLGSERRYMQEVLGAVNSTSNACSNLSIVRYKNEFLYLFSAQVLPTTNKVARLGLYRSMHCA